MHFTYQTPVGELQQGDLLRVSDQLREELQRYHPYYVANQDYKFMMVLTQSCDLALRNGKCVSRYITLAAVRPLKTLVDRELEKHQRSSIEKVHRICSEERKHYLIDFMNKLLNNNLPDYFYLSEEPSFNVTEPHVAFLTLSIAIASDNYEICTNARFGQLTEIFRAKLGWLVGHIYSRVATPDWVPIATSKENFDKLIDDSLDRVALWLNERILEKIKNEQDRLRKEKKDNKYVLPLEEVNALINKYEVEAEEKRQKIAKLLVKQASNILTGTEPQKLKELENSLVNSSELEKLIS